MTSLALTAKAPLEQSLEDTSEGPAVEQSTCGRLLQEESKKEGAVALHVYRAYWRAVGCVLALVILLSLLLMQGGSSSVPQGHAVQVAITITLY